LFFDLGGGTFDVTVLRLVKQTFQVLSINGDTHLGGQDFDQNFVNFMIDEAKRQGFDGISQSNVRVRGKLLGVCREAKIALSNTQSYDISVEALYDGQDFEYSVSRKHFEDCNMELFKKCITCVDNALKDASTQKSAVDEIVMVGGSTRIPKIRQMVKEYFNDKELNFKVDPDEAVAVGAAIQAALDLTRSQPKVIQDSGLREVRILEVCPLDLGIKLIGDKMSVIIKRNTRIPCELMQNYTTTSDNQSSVNIEIYQGPNTKATDNVKLGEFLLKDLPPLKAGQVNVDVSFKLDSNSILNCSAILRENRSIKNSSVINLRKNSSMSPEEIDVGIQTNKKFDAASIAIQDKKIKLNHLEIRLSEVSEGLQNKKSEISNTLVSQITEFIDETNKFVTTQRRNLTASLPEIERKITELEEKVMPARLNK